MIRCKNAGNFESFRKEYYRPPAKIFEVEPGSQYFVIYRNGRASEKINPDLYSAKKTVVYHKGMITLQDNAAYGAIILGGYGEIMVPDKEPVTIESVSMFPTRDDLGGDEIFVSKDAASKLIVNCRSLERLSLYQHFASNSNPEATKIDIPENYVRFG